MTITDVDGNTFIDFAGGVGTLNVGHSHPDVVAAAQEQLERFSHTDFTVVPYEVYVTLAERLAERVPISGPVKAGFFNAGTEAVENAVKFARAYTKRPAVIAFEGGFHGRTLMSLSLTSKSHPYKAGLGPFAPEVYRVPFPYAYRGITTEDALAALERALHGAGRGRDRGRDRVRAGAGRGRLRRRAARVRRGACAAICDEHGIVLVADEVQTGFGRTGRFFAMEHFGVEPDLITVAKSIASGPAALGRARPRRDHGRARSRRRRRHLRRQPRRAGGGARGARRDRRRGPRRALGGRSARRSARACSRWQERWPAIGDVRGLGSMLAIELVSDPATKAPAPELASAPSSQAALERGLLLITCGVYGNCIRVLVPLVITDAELDEALGVWEEALEAALD